MYEFVAGPLAWLSFCTFFAGLFWRMFSYIRGLDWQMDRVTYSVNVYYGIKGMIRSIIYWLLPFGTRGWRFYPWLTVFFFVFHFTLLFTPIFLLAHNILLMNKFGISFWVVSEYLSNIMTLFFFFSLMFIILRRIALPEVRILTSTHDYLVLFITSAPFITGFIAFNQIGNYDFWIVAHVICADIMLIAIPFTKLSHCLLFFLSRGQIGMDYGIKRGGMKNKGMAW